MTDPPDPLSRLDDPDFPALTMSQAAALLGVQAAFLRSLDSSGFLQPYRSAPSRYRAMHSKAYRAIKRADPLAQVLIGELMPGANRSKSAPALSFLRRMTCVDRRYRRRGLAGALLRAAVAWAAAQGAQVLEAFPIDKAGQRRRDDDVHRQDAATLPVPRTARPRDEGAGLPRRRHHQRPARGEGEGRPEARASGARRAPVRPGHPAAGGDA